MIVVPIGLVLAWTQRADGPSRSEIAQALHDAGRGDVHAEDVRDLDCTARASGGYACTWRQRERGGWEARRGEAFVAGQQWRMVEADTP